MTIIITKIDRRTKLKRRNKIYYILPPYTWIVLIKNQNKSNGRLNDTKKNLK